MADIKRYYGWHPPRPEQLATAPKYKAPMRLVAALPAKVDLSAHMPSVWDQGQLGACTAHMSAALLSYDQQVESLPLTMPSRLFSYYNSRLIEGTTSQDAGASIADAVKAIAQYGWCPESEWPYSDAGNQFALKPSAQCYRDAAPNKISDYLNVNQNADDIKGALASGEPVGFGFVVYPSFESDAVAQSGICPMPTLLEQMGQAVGGHAVVLCGYDDAKQMFLVRNSWGTSWGLSGYFWMPYQYTLSASLASDFWVIRTIPGQKPAPPSPPPSPPSPAPDGKLASFAGLDAADKILWKLPVPSWLGA